MSELQSVTSFSLSLSCFFELLCPKLLEIANSFVNVNRFVVVSLTSRMFSMFSAIRGHEALIMFTVEFVYGFNHRHS